MKLPELKNCPLCDRPAKLYTLAGWGLVKCGTRTDSEDGCGLRLETKLGPAEAVELWNRRTK